jgi:hypothetical protein
MKKITSIPQSVAIIAGFFSFLISACSPLNAPSSPTANMPGKTGKSQWFKEDFKQKTDASETPTRAEVPGNPLLAFIRPYIRNEAIIDSMGDNWNVRVFYLPYDWRLNEQI